MTSRPDMLHHNPPAGMSMLPPNWTSYKDPHGREYYYNTATKETTWSFPEAAAPAPPPPPTAASNYYLDQQNASHNWHASNPNGDPQVQHAPAPHLQSSQPHPSQQHSQQHSQQPYQFGPQDSSMTSSQHLYPPMPQQFYSQQATHQQPHSQHHPSSPFPTQPSFPSTPSHPSPPSHTSTPSHLSHPPQPTHPSNPPHASQATHPPYEAQPLHSQQHVDQGAPAPHTQSSYGHGFNFSNPPHSNASQIPAPAPVPPPSYPSGNPQFVSQNMPSVNPTMTYDAGPAMQSAPATQPHPEHASTAELYSMGPAESVFNIVPQPQLSLPMDMSGSVVYIELEMRAVDLKKKDIIGTSDPICYLQVPQRGTYNVNKSTKWESIAQTEHLENTTSPSWSKRFRIPFLFEQNQPLRFYLVDVDNFKTKKGDNLGICIVPLANIVRNGSLTVPLTDVNGRAGKFGKLTIRAHDENAAGQVRLKLSLGAKSLQNVEFMGKSDPFYELHCQLPDGAPSTNLLKSEHVMNNLNPRWKPQTVIVPTGGHAWEQVQFNVRVYDWNQTRSHRLIGEAGFSLAQLTQMPSPSFPLTNPRKSSKLFPRNRGLGELLVHEVKAQEKPSFISYIQGGLRLKFVVAVDFTSSNKPVNNKDSLHYMGEPGAPPQSVYAQALQAVGSVVSSYIPDEMITALGFGAKLPGGKKASFDFALTGQSDPRVRGVDGLLNAYAQAAQNVRLAGPTLFTPLIRNTMNICKQDPVSEDNQNFTVLLILTDGLITDMTETIDAIIDASYTSPLSIVIVGVGSEDFSAMKRLDSDDKALCSEDGKRVAKHDIVQFTPFAASRSLEALAAEVLHEVPQRLVEYMMDAGIKPRELALGGGGVPPMYGGPPSRGYSAYP